VFFCILLLLTLMVQVLLPHAQPLPEASALAPRRPRPVVPPAMPAYPAILAAPIFSPDRKPGEDEDATPGAGALDGYSALGVALGRGFATAVVKGPDGAAHNLHVGDSLQTWRLISIKSDQLTFQRETVRHVMPVGAAAAAPPVQNGNDDQ
jgi:hypothetical protein